MLSHNVEDIMHTVNLSYITCLSFSKMIGIFVSIFVTSVVRVFVSIFVTSVVRIFVSIFVTSVVFVSLSFYSVVI